MCHLFQLRWEKRTRFLSPPPPPPRWVELTLKHQFLNTEPSQIARVFLFPFPFFFFLFKPIGFSLSCSFLFPFSAVSRLGWGILWVFCFVFPLAVRGSRLGQGLGLLLVGFLFIHLFHLHPPILKPDFDLPLGEVENPGHLIPTVPG